MKQNNLTIVAVLGVCNGLSLNIYGIEYGIEDHVITGYSGEPPRKNKLYYNTNGEAYFKKYGKRFYIDDFLRVNE